MSERAASSDAADQPRPAPAIRPNGPGDSSPGLRPKVDALGKENHPTLRPERPRELSIPNVAFVKFDLIGLEERTEFLLKRFDPVMLALIADIGPNVFDL